MATFIKIHDNHGDILLNLNTVKFIRPLSGWYCDKPANAEISLFGEDTSSSLEVLETFDELMALIKTSRTTIV